MKECVNILSELGRAIIGMVLFLLITITLLIVTLPVGLLFALVELLQMILKDDGDSKDDSCGDMCEKATTEDSAGSSDNA